MNTAKAIAPALAACAAALGLAACSGGAGMQATPPSAIAPATTQSSTQANATSQTNESDAGSLEKKAAIPALAARASVTKSPEKRKTWFAKDVGAMPRPLFISDYGANDVQRLHDARVNAQGADHRPEFTRRPVRRCKRKHLGCQYRSGRDAAVASRSGALLKTLSVPNEFPASCAVDRKTGDLAVSNIESTSGPGNIMIFKNGSGSGTPYSSASIYQYFFAGYDESGNLFFDGTDDTRSTSYSRAARRRQQSESDLAEQRNAALRRDGAVVQGGRLRRARRPAVRRDHLSVHLLGLGLGFDRDRSPGRRISRTTAAARSAT